MSLAKKFVTLINESKPEDEGKSSDITEGKFDGKRVDGWLIQKSDMGMSGSTTATFRLAGGKEIIFGILDPADWLGGGYFFSIVGDDPEDQKDFSSLGDTVKYLAKEGIKVSPKAQEALLYEFSSFLAKGFK